MQNWKNECKIKILKNGPYLVTGSVPLSEKIIVPVNEINEYHQGREFPLMEEYALCRCGHSNNQPYCDGSHECENKYVCFDGTETASREVYADRASLVEGSALYLMDDKRCVNARFCHRNDSNVWEMVQNSDDPHIRTETIKAVCDCPSGRLVVLDEDGNPIEPKFEPSIEILQDSANGLSAPIFVKGNIPIESEDGFIYEVRNRAALCRCGKSSNKPFCDATHFSIAYRDWM
jgi:CDGSH-type Zn-finger protein